MIGKPKKIVTKVILRIGGLRRSIARLKRRTQDMFLYFRVRSYAKSRGFLLPGKDSRKERVSINKPSPVALEHLDSMILNKLQLLQFGMPLQEAKFFKVDPGAYGFGAAVPILLSKYLAYCYLYNRTLLFDDRHLVYDFCYEPISSHCLESINLEGNKAVEFNFLPQKHRVVHRSNARPKFLQQGLVNTRFNFVFPAMMPFNMIYIKGLILDRFLKLKPEYKAHIEEKKKEMGFKNPIIGVHIRHGDSPIYSRYFPLQTYLEVVRQVVNKTGIKTVFVTTDSDEVIRQLPKNSGIDFIYDDCEKRYNTGTAGMLRGQPELRKQETLTAVKNIYALGDCDYIIGSHSSFFYMASALSYFRKKERRAIRIEKRDATDYVVENLFTNDDDIKMFT